VSNDGKLARLAPESIETLNSFLPAHWSHGNPVDILGDATPDRYSRALDIVLKDSECDGVLVLTAPQGITEPTHTAELLKPYAHSTGKPVLSCFMGGTEVASANEILNRAGIPTFQFPDTAARAFTYMWKYSYNLKGLYETPILRPDSETGRNCQEAEALMKAIRETGRTLLTETESKQVLAAYGIPVVETRAAKTAEEAAKYAHEIGYPVVLKLHSSTITHKSKVGGVRLNLRDGKAVKAAFHAIEASVRNRAGEGHFEGVSVQPMVALDGIELILGSSIDPQFGPVLLFGAGGRMVEVFKDRALALPPLNTTLARRMMEQTRVFGALEEAAQISGLDLRQIDDLLVRFSRLVTEQPWIKEIDINPLLASPEGMVALDARVVLHGLELGDEHLPRPAIRPYPSQLVQTWTMKNGTEVTIRPIRPEDELLMIEFHGRLSDRTVYLRYFQPLKLTQRIAHERLTRICFIDYDREMALVVEYDDPERGKSIIGVGRLSKLHGREDAEVAVLVRDDFQGQGLGTELVRRLLAIAKDEKLKHVHSTMLGINREMRVIFTKLGFKIDVDLEEDLVSARVALK